VLEAAREELESKSRTLRKKIFEFKNNINSQVVFHR
jgi:hypothetical protein